MPEPKSHKELAGELAKRCNISEAQAKLIIDDFWIAFRYFLSNPDKMKKGIQLRNFLKVDLKKKRIDYEIKKLSKNLIEKRLKRSIGKLTIPEELKLLNNIKNQL